MLLFSKKIAKLEKKITKLHKDARGPSKRILSKWANRIELVIKYQTIIYVGASILLVSSPFLVYFIFNERMTIIAVQIPFVSLENWSGYIITNSYLLLCSFLAVPILLSVDALFMLFCFTGAAYIDLVRNKCNELSEKLADTEHKISDKKIAKYLTDIFAAGHIADR